MGNHLLKVTGFRIEPEVLEKLTKLAQEQGTDRNKLVNQILKEYVKKNAN